VLNSENARVKRGDDVRQASVEVCSWDSARWLVSAAAMTDEFSVTSEPAVDPSRHFPASPTPTADWPASSPARRESPATNCCGEGSECRAHSTTTETVRLPWTSAAASEPLMLRNT